MPRYHFRVHDEWGEAPDDQGTDLPDLDAARLHAIAGARSLMSHSVLAGILDFGARIDIEDGDGNVLTSICYRDAVTLSE